MKLGFLVLIFIFSCSVLQMVDWKEANEKLQSVREVQGRNKSFLYSKALEWIARRYVSAKSVIDLNDPENGRLIAKTRFVSKGAYIAFTLIIVSKDGKYKFAFENPVEENAYGQPLGYLSRYSFNLLEENFKESEKDFYEFVLGKDSRDNF